MMRRPGALLQTTRPFLLITIDPLVDAIAAHSINARQVTYAIVATQVVSYHLYSLAHLISLVPRHQPTCHRCDREKLSPMRPEHTVEAASPLGLKFLVY